MAKIDQEAVNAVFLDCLFRPGEMGNGQTPTGAILVEGIIDRFAFHPDRLESHREEVRQWLLSLPPQFRASNGGGWSFLNASDDAAGHQWTASHERVEQLFCLGIGLSLARCLFPRELWAALPGEMPYYAVIDLKEMEKAGRA